MKKVKHLEEDNLLGYQQVHEYLKVDGNSWVRITEYFVLEENGKGLLGEVWFQDPVDPDIRIEAGDGGFEDLEMRYQAMLLEKQIIIDRNLKEQEIYKK